MVFKCACGARKEGIFKRNCECDWYKWTVCDEDGKLEMPKKDGLYRVRYYDDEDNQKEGPMKFQVKPYRVEKDFFTGKQVPIHWERESLNLTVFAWKDPNA